MNRQNLCCIAPPRQLCARHSDGFVQLGFEQMPQRECGQILGHPDAATVQLQ
jgi:hypothetical protein